jgi:Ribbon-helix-helix protein, copG family
MKKSKIPPPTASVQELAKFFDTHSLADFQDELVDVEGPVFVREDAVRVELDSTEAEAVDKLARARKMSRTALIRSWVVEKLNAAKAGTKP